MKWGAPYWKQEKRNPCHLITQSLTVLCPEVTWKAAFVNNELRYLAEEISKQSVEDTPQFLLAALSKMQEERYQCREELLSTKNQ